MGFDENKFMNAKFQHRTKEIKVPELKSFFNDDDEAVWIVRGLTGPEVGSCKQAAAKDKSYIALLKAIQDQDVSKKIEGITAALDLGQGTKTGEIPERIHQLVAGSVEPKCTVDLAVKICKTFPTIFYNLSNTILLLSGQGQEIQGESKGS